MTGQRPPKSPPPPPPYFELPAGAKIEFLHRFCPRCGLNLVEEPPQSEADHQQADEIKGVADQAGISWVAGDEHFVPMIKRQFFEWISQFRRLF